MNSKGVQLLLSLFSKRQLNIQWGMWNFSNQIFPLRFFDKVRTIEILLYVNISSSTSTTSHKRWTKNNRKNSRRIPTILTIVNVEHHDICLPCPIGFCDFTIAFQVYNCGMVSSVGIISIRMKSISDYLWRMHHFTYFLGFWWTTWHDIVRASECIT